MNGPRVWGRGGGLVVLALLLLTAATRAVRPRDVTVVTTYHANGQLAEQRQYRHGREEGVHRGWHANGARRFVYRYVNGVADGVQEDWYPDGTPYTRFEYVARDTTFQVLSYTVQPDRDSVGALVAYAERNEIADPRWHLLTAPWDRVADLAANGYFVNLRDGTSYGTDDLAHTETLVLIDQDARIRGVYNATLALDMEQIVRDVATLERAGR